MITGYDLVRSVLADPRFSSRKELLNVVDFEIPPAPPGEFLLMDEPQHGRYRKPLVGKFTARRMRLLTERIEQITKDCLDAMEETGPAVDLVTAFAKPIPTIIICELLGVPYEDRASFQEQIDKFMNGETGDEELQGISLILLAAGFDTTANMLALGAFALLQNPEQLAALRADPALVDQAVEELLRYLSVAKSFMRTALEDVEV
ncbi:cytochrome P450, partial [Streptomyces sp. NPDC059956]